MVKRGETKYQLQTEYARHPRPRITTTIFSQGQVFHKIEKTIDYEIDSIERMHEAEDIIKVQHNEISRIIREKGLPSGPAADKMDAPESKIRSERIRRLDEVKKVYLITSDGKLSGNRETTTEFKRVFKHVLKELPEMLRVFASLPGPGDRREEGIYEIEPGKLILASTGAEFYLILLESGTNQDQISEKLKNILEI